MAPPHCPSCQLERLGETKVCAYMRAGRNRIHYICLAKLLPYHFHVLYVSHSTHNRIVLSDLS